MYISETPSLREIEKTMKMIPNFTPRGHGVVILCKHEFAEENCIGVSQKEKRALDQIIRYMGYLEQVHAPVEYLEQVKDLQKSVADLTTKAKDLKPFRFRL